MNDSRSDYLAQLGVDVYVRRSPTDAAVTTASAPIAPTASITSTVPTASNTSAAPEASARVYVPQKARAPARPLVDPPADRPRTAGAAVAAMDWQALRSTVAACTLCALHTTRTQTVFGVGDPDADWLVIGEAPGAEEDARGEPFVGRAGGLLNSMLAAIGFKREQVFIANILKCRPPGNRDPKPEEALLCRPYLERQIALIAPKIILAVGRIAAQNLLATQTPIGKLRGRLHHFGAARTPLVVTYHPAYLLRSPGEKRKAWADLKLAVETVGGRLSS